MTKPEVGEIVEFTGYQTIEPGTPAILETGQKVKIIKIDEDEEGNSAFSVRPLLEDGAVDLSKGETLFSDEFKVIEPATEADTKTAEKPKKSTTSKSKKKAKEDKEAAKEYDPNGPLMAAEGFEHDPLITELIRGTNNITELAYSLYVQQEELYFKLGGVLLDLQEKRVHKDAGYEDTAVGFAEYVKDHVGPERRHCYYLISMYKRFRRAGISVQDLRGIGWTKARLILNVKDDDIQEFLELAKEKTRKELEQIIEGKKVLEDITKKRYVFTLYGDANTLVEQAFEHAKTQVDGETDREIHNKAFEYICNQYLIIEGNFNSNQEEENTEVAAKEND